MTNSSKNTVYQFADFRADVTNKTLVKGGEVIALTPKVFDTLVVLIENAGNLVEKDELMHRIWRDSFVEESNLTFNIKMLRKALDDSATKPTFIETVPRRGYRFIAEVSTITEVANKPFSQPETHRPVNLFSKSNLLFIALLIALISSIVFASWFWQNRNASANAPILSNKFELIKLTENGKVVQSAISPDGKFAAYSSEAGGRQSVWLRQLENNVNIEIVPPSTEKYYGLKFSRDGKTLFFTRSVISQSINLFSISIFGGVPTKIAGNTQGLVSVSPDDKKIAFVRYEEGKFDENSLYIVDIDGKNEQLIKESEYKKVFWSLDFSPNGKSIAVAVGQTDNASQDMSLVEIEIETGNQRNLSNEKFFNISTMVWLPNKSGLIIGANERISEPTKLWQVNYADGNLLPLSKDSLSYTALTLTQAGDKLSATVVNPDFHLFTSTLDKPNEIKELAQSRDGFALTTDERIVFASDTGGNEDLWIMNLDGTNQRQLTMDKHLDAYPYISLDNRHIYFTSNRTGQMQVWRMNTDGTEQTQITQNDGGYPIQLSANKKTLIYQKARLAGFWKLSLESGEETEIIARKNYLFSTFSPDGKLFAFAAKNREDNTYQIDVMDVETKKIVKSFAPANEKHCPIFLNWFPNKNGFSYVSEDDEKKNSLWIQTFEEVKPALSQSLGSEEIMSCKYSPNGKNIVFIRGAWKHDAVLLNGLR